MTQYEGCEVILTKGDTLTSKKGMLFKTNLTGTEEFYYVYKAKYLGDGHWEAIKKSEAEAHKVDA
jgi:phosphoglucomutase